MAERTHEHRRDASRAARHSRPSRWRRGSPLRREAREPTPSAGPGAAKETPGITLRSRGRPRRDFEPADGEATIGSDRNSGTTVSRDGVHHAGPSPGCGHAGTRVLEPEPTQQPGRRPGDVAGLQTRPGNPPGGLARETSQRNVSPATGRTSVDSQEQRENFALWDFPPWKTRSCNGGGACCWSRSTSRTFATSRTAFAPAAAAIKRCTHCARGCSSGIRYRDRLRHQLLLRQSCSMTSCWRSCASGSTMVVC